MQIKKAVRYWIFLYLTVSILSLYFINCKQSEKAAADASKSVPALNAEQQKLLDGYIQRLQEFPKFSNEVTEDNTCNWKYDLNSPDLDNLKKTYDLKTIIGTGTEIEGFLNLTDWVHRITKSQGELGNPDTLTSIAIINYVKTRNHAVNCKMKAIVLNEILLSFGYYSRRISFMPSIFDGDLHSIVTVYSNELKKWVCLDPTFNTYFHDADGNLLGYLEIRDAYTSGRIPEFRSINMTREYPLRMAGIEFYGYDQWYSVYMAKNCFRASCPQTSQFGYDTLDDRILVNLLPVGYTEDNPSVNTISTNNSYVFFQQPL